MFVCVCVHASRCTLRLLVYVFEHLPPNPPTRVSLADKPQGGGLWLRAAVMDRARLEARPNGLHSRQKLVTTCLSLNTPQLCYYFLHCEMSNGSGKSEKYSLSIWGFNYLLTQEGFVKKKKERRKERKKMFVYQKKAAERKGSFLIRQMMFTYITWFLSLYPSGMSQSSLAVSSQQSLLN